MLEKKSVWKYEKHMYKKHRGVSILIATLNLEKNIEYAKIWNERNLLIGCYGFSRQGKNRWIILSNWNITFCLKNMDDGWMTVDVSRFLLSFPPPMIWSALICWVLCGYRTFSFICYNAFCCFLFHISMFWFYNEGFHIGLIVV